MTCCARHFACGSKVPPDLLCSAFQALPEKPSTIIEKYRRTAAWQNED